MSGFLQLIKRNNAVGNRLELRAVVVIIDAHADFCRPLVRRFQLGAGRLELLGSLVVGAAMPMVFMPRVRQNAAVSSKFSGE